MKSLAPGPGKQTAKLGLVWRNRKKISQIINAYLYFPFFLLIILWSLRRENVRIQRNLIHKCGIFPHTNARLQSSVLIYCLFHLCSKHVTQYNTLAWRYHLFSVRTEPLTYKVIHTHLHACARNVKPSRFFKMVWFGRV
jgi:hypothetical protein